MDSSLIERLPSSPLCKPHKNPIKNGVTVSNHTTVPAFYSDFFSNAPSHVFLSVPSAFLLFLFVITPEHDSQRHQILTAADCQPVCFLQNTFIPSANPFLIWADYLNLLFPTFVTAVLLTAATIPSVPSDFSPD